MILIITLAFVDVDGLFYICKMVKIHHQKKPLVKALNFILNFPENWIRFIVISKIEFVFK
jgi:hypothetical protein